LAQERKEKNVFPLALAFIDTCDAHARDAVTKRTHSDFYGVSPIEGIRFFLFFSPLLESSYRRHFGTKSVDMTSAGVLECLCGLQKAKLRENDMIHSDKELGLQLRGREAADRVMVDVFKMRHKNLSNPSRRDDRFQYPMIVCRGWGKLGCLRNGIGCLDWRGFRSRGSECS
jgi:hypothetical protein